MFKKLHLQFTLFCTAITGAILCAMACICLYISQSDTLSQSFLSFQGNIGSLISYLEDQPVITHRWIREIEHSYGLQIEISDGGSPLFFQELDGAGRSHALFESALSQAQKEFSMNPYDDTAVQKLPEHTEFRLEKDKNCYASVGVVPRKQGSLKLVALYPLDRERRTIRRQRILFAAAVLAAILLLAAFSWFFTRSILSPVEENRRQQTEFIAAASHELRTPLTIILTSLSAMEDASPEIRRRFADNIREEGGRMKRLIDDMLLLASVDSSRWTMNPAPAEPDTLLLDVFEKYLTIAGERGISLDIRLPIEPVPPAMWDRDRILQVLEILADNALHYTPAGGKVLLNLCMRSGAVEYRVADTGPGIPDSEKAAVFRRFYRGDSAHRDRDHFGLGLCIAGEIVRLHRGKLWVEDTPGGGATFVALLQVSAPCAPRTRV